MYRPLKFLVFILALVVSIARAEDAAYLSATAAIVQTAKKSSPDIAAEKAVVTQIIDALAAKELETNDVARKEPQRALDHMEFVVSRPGAEPERAAFCTLLAEKLGGALHVPAKVWLLKSLERIGKAESVPAEVKALSDASELVRETARRALAANPSKESSDELITAIAASGDIPTRVALIEALGFKRNKADVKLFENEMRSPDGRVKAAAMAALTAQGIRKEADAMEQAAGLIDAGRAGKAESIATLVTALGSDNIKIRQAAVQAVALHAAPDMTAALVAKLKAAPADVKPALIAVLGQRGDKAALPALLEEIKNPDAAVRIAAVQALGHFNDSSAFNPLIALARTSGDDQRVARESLDRIMSPEIDDKLTEVAMGDPVQAMRIEALQRLATRNAVNKSSGLLPNLTVSDSGVRIETVKTLGAIGGKDALEPVLSIVVKATDKDAAERDAAAKSLVTISRRLPENGAHLDAVAKAAKDSSEPARIALLTSLGQIAGSKALAAVHDGMKDANEKIQDAAFRALANWPDSKPIDDMLELAKSSKNDTHRVLALRAFVRMAALPGEHSAKETLALCAKADDAVKTPDDRKLVLNAVSDIKDFGAVHACAKYIADAKVSEEACVATVKVAKRYESGHAAEIAAAMKDVIAHTKNKSIKDQAQALLDKQGQK